MLYVWPLTLALHSLFQAMIDEFDRDQDGEINEDEFTYIMAQSSNE